MAERLRAEVRQALSLGGLFNNVLGNIVTAALAVGLGFVVRAVTDLSLVYLIPLAVLFFLLLGAASNCHSSLAPKTTERVAAAGEVLQPRSPRGIRSHHRARGVAPVSLQGAHP
jgi:hypothetical protein